MGINRHLKTKSHSPKFQFAGFFCNACGTSMAFCHQNAGKTATKLCQVDLGTNWPHTQTQTQTQTQTETQTETQTKTQTQTEGLATYWVVSGTLILWRKCHSKA